MKKSLLTMVIILNCFIFSSCTSKKESASDIAKRWCALENAADNLEDPQKRIEAEKTLKKFEKEMEAKYKGKQEFWLEIWGLYSDCSGRS